MADIEKIQGNAVSRILNELHQDKTPLEMELLDRDYKRTTYIRDIRNRRRNPCFLVDSPEGFQEATHDLDAWRLRFEFTARDKIKYVFTIDGAEFSRGTIYIRLPENIDRYQRRRLFRLEAPPGTRLYFDFNNTRYELLVSNVSLGGTFGVLVSLTKKMEQDLKLYKPKRLENVELVFPCKDDKEEDSKVNIKRCQINRQQKNPLTNNYEYAIQFTELTEAEQQKFTELFQKWQRDFLRKRRLMKIS